MKLYIKQKNKEGIDIVTMKNEIERKLILKNYWKDVLAQNKLTLPQYFCEGAYINWHNTNEHFTIEEFIIANCEYPNEWDGTIERMECIDDLVICVCHVYTKDKSLSFHVTSFIQFSEKDRILCIDEYWGDDGLPPKWRQKKNIGTNLNLIKKKGGIF